MFIPQTATLSFKSSNERRLTTVIGPASRASKHVSIEKLPRLRIKRVPFPNTLLKPILSPFANDIAILIGPCSTLINIKRILFSASISATCELSLTIKYVPAALGTIRRKFTSNIFLKLKLYNLSYFIT